MRYRRLGLPVFALAATVIAGMVAVAPSAAASTGISGVTRQISSSGSTSFNPTPEGTDPGLQADLTPGTTDGAGNASSHNQNGVNRSRSIEHTAASVPLAPIAQGVGVSSSGPLSVTTSFDGLNHRNQRLANGGNQFSLEPPDQGLCVGNGFEMEIINDVMKIFTPSGGVAKSTEDLNTFFNYPAQIIRANPNVTPPILRMDGPFVTDPSCYYDKDTNRWFADVLTIDVFPMDNATLGQHAGDFVGSNHIDLAVSDTGAPTGTWKIYSVQVQDDGNNGTQDHHCTGIAPFGQQTTPTFPNACLGDYPHLGADANGIYVTTNEYSLFGNDFHGAQLYAFSKSDLTSATPSAIVTQFDTHFKVTPTESGFTIWPATAPADSTHNLNSGANGGTEYFLSSNAADEAHGNGVNAGPRRSTQLLVWSLDHTSSIASAPTDMVLSNSTLSVGLYVVPARSEQKVGSTPLVDCLNMKSCATNFLLGVPDPFAPEHESNIDSNDTRMQQVVYADGRLWGALDTAVNSSANTRAGVEWFVVDPAAHNGAGKLVNSGYLAVSQNNVTYPAVSVTPSGQGVMAFTLVGRDFYPSAAFASISADGTGPVQVAALGIGPDDGFTGTAVFNAPNPPRPRWGDYGAAVYDGATGMIWMASEYIGQTCTLREYLATFASCNGTRTTLANWDTRITEVNPAA